MSAFKIATLTTARSHIPDSPPDFSAGDCSPLLSSATCAGLDRTARITKRKSPDFSGLFVLLRTVPDFIMVQSIELID
ncbi:MAG: hypothetical protein FD174_1444 [Geobacteraceae bacterium]|nr:MAG: hypothetical protein FD174_1444 [Geobacteraceae bacterium]